MSRDPPHAVAVLDADGMEDVDHHRVGNEPDSVRP